jgi:hypothetical protein
MPTKWLVLAEISSNLTENLMERVLRKNRTVRFALF